MIGASKLTFSNIDSKKQYTKFKIIELIRVRPPLHLSKLSRKLVEASLPVNKVQNGYA